MKRVAFHTLGCKVNQYDTQVLVKLFKDKGYEVVDFKEEADLYIINTCTVTATGDSKSRQAIRRTIKNNPKAMVVVTGCYAQTDPEAISSIDGVDLIVGVNERAKIVDLVEEKMSQEQTSGLCRVGPMGELKFEDLQAELSPDRVRTYIKIQDGCEYFCTYCKVPYARGPMRSRNLDSIIAEARRAVEQGVKEIVLTGIHLGAYGKEQGGDIALSDVIESLHDLQGLERIRLGSIEPMDISQELLETMGRLYKVCRHIHIPLQSGDDMILKRMYRTYTTEEFRTLVNRIKETLPDCGVTTDVIVGFPGETEESFIKTYDFIKDMKFSRLHVFKFSKRSGTPAASFPDQVESEVKNLRRTELISLGQRLSLAFHESLLNKKVDVLIERYRKKRRVAEGLTDTYVRAYSSGGPDDFGRLVSLYVQRADENGVYGVIS